MRSALNVLFCYACFALCLMQVTACFPQKDNVASRGMQNLTARYNILYNARELIKESELNIQLAYRDNYDVLITAYKEPNESLSQPESKKMDDVILKANSIINDKSQSNYVDDAYFVIAKANFLKSNFFNATEFFSYIYNSYPKQNELKQSALAYKARALMNSDRFLEARETLDSAFKYLETEKKSVADLYAIKAQLAIYGRNDEEAAILLEKAISFADKGQNKIRWTYLLAQLQQLTGKREAALQNYSRVIKSNAPFEMAFNAKLNHLSIRDEQSGRVVNRAEQLLSLLKDDNNLDFADQVYYQIGQSYIDKGDMGSAVENFNTSIRRSTQNNNQKGLSYLALADIYFKQADYVKSKAYYDSTLTSLSTQHRDFDQIRKKAGSLELLANRLSIIAREDTLQMLASLPEAERQQRIGVLVRNQAQQAINPQSNSSEYRGESGIPAMPMKNIGSEKFYFNNPIALSQGLSDFKRIWGNRKLEDNWRRSQRSSSDLAAANNNNADFIIPANPDERPAGPDDLNNLLTTSIPLTPEKIAESNQRILSAYYDIGNYYRETLNDESEAIKTYETIMARFPDNNLKLPIYYNLYRLYASSDPKKSSDYKNILLNQFPESPFARIIRNPDYNRQTDDQEIALHKFYNQVYETYVQRNYPEVVRLTREAEKSFSENKLSPQLAYLHALAVGHTQKINVLDSAFRKIVTDFPEDKLVVPLVKQHLEYIEQNRVAMSKRKFALLDSDPNETIFVEEPNAVQAIATASQPQPVYDQANKNKPDPAVTATQKPEPTVPVAVEEVKGVFSLTTSSEYYFVINVSDPSVNLSSSRFGVGQFNRSSFAGVGIKHQLKSVNNQNQLIFVGIFTNKEAVADYHRIINPLMKEIMKVPADRYNTFYISKENLEKLTDRESIIKYIEFYQQNLAGTNN